MDSFSKSRMKKMAPNPSRKTTNLQIGGGDDDDFQNPLQSLPILTQTNRNRNPNPTRSSQQPLQPSNSLTNRPPKKQKKQHLSTAPAAGKENNLGPPTSTVPLLASNPSYCNQDQQQHALSPVPSLDLDLECSLESIEPTICVGSLGPGDFISAPVVSTGTSDPCCGLSVCENDDKFEPGTQFQVLLNLCSEGDDDQFSHQSNTDAAESGPVGCPIQCPICGDDISHLNDQLRQLHTNHCLDKVQSTSHHVASHDNDQESECPGQVLDNSPAGAPRQDVDVSPVLKWLRNLGLAKYEEVFIREEIDWDSLQWLTDEDLCNIGVTALGPRKKIVHALSELKRQGSKAVEVQHNVLEAETCKLDVNKLITDYFPGFSAHLRKSGASGGQREAEQTHKNICSRRAVAKRHVSDRCRDLPLWCSIPGTPFTVDAFKYLHRYCLHWFLTHFHTDHYQGLTKSFCHGKIYCSLITAKLVNLKIGIPWDKIEVLPLNQKISISGINVTCFDANHCPGAIMILFEPPSGKAVLHTGDFRFSDDMAKISVFQTSHIHTLILDTTYCDPQYDFPKQDAIIQYVMEVIQAEAFNPRTLFLIGSYTIGKERLFVEVARVLRKKVYVPAAKLRLLECLGIPKEDIQWFTLNEQESDIHVVPMWTLASFKRLKHISQQYMGRFNLIVAFSPTGWTFGRGKKSSPGRRSQQGTIIRYEVPYSEHCSFTELKEFVKFVSPANIVPSVNNHGPESTNAMTTLLSS